MKTKHYLFTALILVTLSSTLSANVAPPPMPKDVSNFIEKRDNCIHWLGEPSEGDKERQAEVLEGIKTYCTGCDAEYEKLKAKYKDDDSVMRILKYFDEKVGY